MKLTDLLKEDYDVNDLTDKDKKKMTNVLTALKSGIIRLYDHRIKYVLGDNYEFEIGSKSGKPFIVMIGTIEEVCKLYAIIDTGDLVYMQPSTNEVVYRTVSKKIEERFLSFGITLVF